MIINKFSKFQPNIDITINNISHKQTTFHISENFEVIHLKNFESSSNHSMAIFQIKTIRAFPMWIELVKVQEEQKFIKNVVGR